VKIAEEHQLAIDGAFVDDEDLTEAARNDRVVQAVVHAEMNSCVGQIISDLEFVLKQVNVS